MKAVVVHRGARDSYQVALALAERGMLERLVTDLYWSGTGTNPPGLLGSSIATGLRARRCDGLDGSLVNRCLCSGLLSFAFEKSARLPFSWRARMARWADGIAGARAGRLASREGAALLSYSYYGYSAFTHAAPHTPRILFQLHPHPSSVRKILLDELSNHSECAESLRKEWELALPEKDFQRLVQETEMADAFLVASTFSRNTLVENGVPADRIRVAPYGVNLTKFQPLERTQSFNSNQPLRLLFVGQISQRKGIKYLLQALALIPLANVKLTVCGRVVDDLSLFRNADARVTVRGSVSAEELRAAYRESDLFVFPSLAEGFAHVLLEAMASGLPILSTTRTAAPDLVTEGVDGFVVEPCCPASLAECIEWAADHRRELAEMGRCARLKAEQFTWKRFRDRVADSIDSFCMSETPARKAAQEVAHV